MQISQMLKAVALPWLQALPLQPVLRPALVPSSSCLTEVPLYHSRTTFLICTHTQNTENLARSIYTLSVDTTITYLRSLTFHRDLQICFTPSHRRVELCEKESELTHFLTERKHDLCYFSLKRSVIISIYYAKHIRSALKYLCIIKASS